MIARLAVVALLAGCYTAHRNAPGVTDLAAPPRVGTSYIAPQSPGMTGSALWVLPFAGMSSAGAAELGGELRLERLARDDDRAQLADSAWGIAVGFVALRGKEVSGERFYTELQHRMAVSEIIPFVVGAGLAMDEKAMPGVQASVHYLMFALRARAHVDGAIDLTFGYELPLAFLFGHSR